MCLCERGVREATGAEHCWQRTGVKPPGARAASREEEAMGICERRRTEEFGGCGVVNERKMREKFHHISKKEKENSKERHRALFLARQRKLRLLRWRPHGRFVELRHRARERLLPWRCRGGGRNRTNLLSERRRFLQPLLRPPPLLQPARPQRLRHQNRS